MTEFMDTKEAAAYLRARPSTLERWRVLRYGPSFIKISPRMIRYRRSDLDAWIEECVLKN